MKIAGRWFEIHRIDDGVTHIVEPYVDPLIRCNVWHVRGSEKDLLIDAGLGIASLKEATKHLFGAPVVAVATHTHSDHVGGFHEFDRRVVHELEASTLATNPDPMVLRREQLGAADIRSLREAGYELKHETLISAVPYAGFDIDAHHTQPVEPTYTVVDGDVIDIGNRQFEVLHLPGHSPGSIGLWEKSTGTLFAGDAIYDGPLLANLPGSNVEDYVNTLHRLKRLKAQVIHGGHDPSFGPDRLDAIADHYLRLWTKEESRSG